MRTGRITRTADLRDNLSCADYLPCYDVQLTAMSVARIRINRGVINQNLIAVTVAQISGNDNLSVEKRSYIFSVSITQINARMKFPFARNRMNSPAKRRSHRKINRLYVRGQNQNREYQQCPNLFQMR